MQQKIQATVGSNGGDQFGSSVDSAGDVLVIGAASEDSDDPANQADTGGSNHSGAAYVFTYDAVANQFVLNQKVKAQNTRLHV